MQDLKTINQDKQNGINECIEYKNQVLREKDLNE